ncbi:M43 family zinc metalloprotease [Spirosoma jeollabukense]
MPPLSLMSRPLLAGSLLLALWAPAWAQPQPVRHFNTQAVRTATLKQFPDYAKTITQLEEQLPTLIGKGTGQQTLQIPVVLHILAADGQTTPTDEQVQAQLAILNQAFGAYTPPKELPTQGLEAYAAQGVEVGIQFVLADAQKGSAIQRVRTDRQSWELLNQIQDPKQGGIAPVDPAHLLNIWIGELEGTNAGYAHLPGAPGELDGIVIDPHYFGTDKGTAKAPYTQGKTLVHLMGTYLGLYDLWDEAHPCQDDGVADTPLHSGPNSQVLGGPASRQICFCPGAPLAMYINYMDNAEDSLLLLFTQGQKDRMRAMLAPDGLRAGLIKR